MQHTFFLVSKQTTFLVLHTFLYISLPFFTSYLHVLRRKCLYCVLRPSSHCFFTATHFHVGIHKHFSFSHRCYIIFMFFFQQNWSPLLFISRSSSFPVIQVNVDINRKTHFFVVCFFLSKNVSMWFTAETSGVLEMQTFTSAITCSFPDGHDSWLPSRSPRVCTVSIRSYSDVMTNFSWIDGLPNFLSYAALLLRALVELHFYYWYNVN